MEKDHGVAAPENMPLALVKSGYGLAGFIPKVRDRVKEGNSIKYVANYGREVQRRFATVGFESGKHFKNNISLVSVGTASGEAMGGSITSFVSV